MAVPDEQHHYLLAPSCNCLLLHALGDPNCQKRQHMANNQGCRTCYWHQPQLAGRLSKIPHIMRWV